ncbi:MAG TPA: alanine racemase [Romboutsia timonensis]|uniref:Alanine racemase n=1 Tax=Romboutsia timonensis TaxID=1776391 RepID=A0A921N0J9_9FIRM|nr:alanine racemase [uncultured Romboutsia sp.]HJG96134.1 alanine racemase [Romboutsia timonensis]
MRNGITAATWAEINLDNINFNLNNIKKLLKEDTKICTVLKANAYGHGSVEIAKFLENKNVDYFAVARLEEAIELRENNIKMPILCLGFVPEESLEYAIKNNITLTIYSLETAKKLNDISEKIGVNANIHIKIDTGMSRIGFEVNEESIDQIIKIANLKNLYIEGIYTHFAKSDEIDKDFTYKQVNRFKFIIDNIEKKGINIPIKHVSNSAAIMDLPNLNFNMVRCGIVLYGCYPSDEVIKDRLQLKPAMTLKTRVSHIKELKEGTGISYGLRYKTRKQEKIATIPIGYADGFTRMQNNPKVSINNEVFNVVGRICMDQCMVRIDKDIDIKIGDEVIIFGESNISADDIAKDLGTINYEILCMVSRRVDRIYKERNVILQADSYLVKLK